MNARATFSFAAFVSGLAIGLSVAAPVLAQERIDRPVKILVGFAAGGTADLIARVVATSSRRASVSR